MRFETKNVFYVCCLIILNLYDTLDQKIYNCNFITMNLNQLYNNEFD